VNSSSSPFSPLPAKKRGATETVFFRELFALAVSSIATKIFDKAAPHPSRNVIRLIKPAVSFSLTPAVLQFSQTTMGRLYPHLKNVADELQAQPGQHNAKRGRRTGTAAAKPTVENLWAGFFNEVEFSKRFKVRRGEGN
jgi:hypothetical protein